MSNTKKKGAAAIAGVLSLGLAATGCSVAPSNAPHAAQVATAGAQEAKAKVAGHITAVQSAVDEVNEKLGLHLGDANYDAERTRNLMIAGNNLAADAQGQADHAGRVANEIYTNLTSDDAEKKGDALADLHTLWVGASTVVAQPDADTAFENVNEFLNNGGPVPNVQDIKAIVDYFIVKYEIPVPTVAQIDEALAANNASAHKVYHEAAFAKENAEKAVVTNVNNSVAAFNRTVDAYNTGGPKAAFDSTMNDFYTNMRNASRDKDAFVQAVRNSTDLEELHAAADHFDALASESIDLLVAGGMAVESIAAIIADSIAAQNPGAGQTPGNEGAGKEEAPDRNDANSTTPNIVEGDSEDETTYPDNSMEVIPDTEAPQPEQPVDPKPEKPAEEDAPVNPQPKPETPVDPAPQPEQPVDPKPETPVEPPVDPQPEPQPQPEPEAPAVSNNQQIANDIYTGINEYRGSNGLPDLAYNAGLEAKAQNQANDMAAAGEIYHSKPTGQSDDRWTENVASMTSSGATGEKFVNAWADSYYHNAAMLDSIPTEYGVGVASGNDGNTYAAVQFR